MYKEENWDSLPSWNDQELKEAALGWDDESLKKIEESWNKSLKKAAEGWDDIATSHNSFDS